jgi:hypothetical protein
MTSRECYFDGGLNADDLERVVRPVRQSVAVERNAAVDMAQGDQALPQAGLLANGDALTPQDMDLEPGTWASAPPPRRLHLPASAARVKKKSAS